MKKLYGDIIGIDESGSPITPEVVLAKRNGSKLGIISNLVSLVQYNKLMSACEISFDVYKFTNENKCELWDDIKDFRLVYIPNFERDDFNPWYELSVDTDDGDDTIKHCSGIHVQESELSRLILNGVEINTESDISRKDYKPSVIYNEKNPEASILNRILKDKAPHYKILYVDHSIKSLQRTFTFDGDSIVDAFNKIAEEIECIFMYGRGRSDGNVHRTISVYDLNDCCLDCGHRGSFVNNKCSKCGSSNIKNGYGDNSGVFLNSENFAQDISYSSNKDEVKNCFRLVAGDDLMTATVRNLNPSGSQYIWYFSESMKRDMSDSLRKKIELYDVEFSKYENEKTIDIPKSSIDEYNSLIEKYKPFNKDLQSASYPIIGYSKLTKLYYEALNLLSFLSISLAPESAKGVPTTAENELKKLTNGSLSTIGVQNATSTSHTTADMYVANYAKIYIDTSLYKLSVENSRYSGNTWIGSIKLTSYTDDKDTATSSPITITISDATPDYIKTQLDKAMKKDDSDATTIMSLFKKNETEFRSALSNYSIGNLKILSSIARGCLDILIQRGIADTSSELYTSLYIPYYNKSKWIESELIERESEVRILKGDKEKEDGLLDIIDKQRKIISEKLDIKTFLGDELWVEFCSFRIDDEYRNDNYISDGLSDQKLIELAGDFMSKAKREIIKSATLQHTIGCNISNFLLLSNLSDVGISDNQSITINDNTYSIDASSTMSPIADNFDVGNWVYISVDDGVFKLRLTDYVIDYDNLESIDVEFSDVVTSLGAMSDIEDLLSKTNSMSSSYPYIQKQASNGDNANQKILDIVANGLSLTNKKIVNSAKNQNMLIDESGMIMREKNEFGEDYSDEQTKIINQGLYFTTDNWKTVKTGLGKYVYYDPKVGKYVEDYGLIANKIVGNLILGNEVGIYNESGSVLIDENGMTITSDPLTDNKNLFTLQRKNKDGGFTKYIYVDTDGSIKINGSSIEMSAGESFTSYIDKTLSNLKVGVRNLIRNSKTMVYKDYGFVNTTSVYVTDENGNRLTDESGNRLIF